MIKIIYYQSMKDLASIHLKNRTWICPSPKVADSWRKILTEHQRSEVSLYEILNEGKNVLTISKWLKGQLPSNIEIKRKSSLMIKLLAVWQQYFNEGSFTAAFDYFTEIRSLTFDRNLMDEIVSVEEENLKKSFAIFSLFLEQEKIVDEHEAYRILRNNFNGPRESGDNQKPVWSFLGIRHLSGIQVDTLKDMAREVEIEIYLPKYIKERVQFTDWITWLSAGEIEQCLDGIAMEKKTLSTIKISQKDVLHLVSKNKTSIFMHSRSDEKIPFIFRSITSDFTHQSFDSDFLVREVELVFEEFKRMFGYNYLLKEDVTNLLTTWESRAKEVNPKNIKVFQLLTEVFEEFFAIQDRVTASSIREIKNIVTLNLPRVKYQSWSKKQTDRLFFQDEAVFLKLDGPQTINETELFITSLWGESYKSGDDELAKIMEKIPPLASISPIKRKGLDFDFFYSEARALLENFKGKIYIEEGIDESDVGWQEILSNFEIDYKVNELESLKITNDKTNTLNENRSFKIDNRKSWSASSLQSYLDCPQKFYYQNIKKIYPESEVRVNVLGRVKGVQEHQVIENYFKLLKDQSYLFNEQVFREAYEDAISKNQQHVKEVEKKLSDYEVKNFAKNGIKYLLEKFIKKEKISHSFEKSFQVFFEKQEDVLMGKIDVFISCDNNEIEIYDFKRKKTAIPTQKEIFDFSAIQMWVYLLYAFESGHSVKKWGYINLEEPESSLIYSEEKLNQELIAKFKTYIMNTIVKIKADNEFAPAPRKNEICTFCSYRNFCEVPHDN